MNSVQTTDSPELPPAGAHGGAEGAQLLAAERPAVVLIHPPTETATQPPRCPTPVHTLRGVHTIRWSNVLYDGMEGIRYFL